jgi:hypothetical protein
VVAGPAEPAFEAKVRAAAAELVDDAMDPPGRPDAYVDRRPLGRHRCAEPGCRKLLAYGMPDYCKDHRDEEGTG